MAARDREQSKETKEDFNSKDLPALGHGFNVTPTAHAVRIGNNEAITAAQRTLDARFGETPFVTETSPSETVEKLHFGRTQQIQQRPGESSAALHERLRPDAIDSFQTVRSPMEIETPSRYTFDASKILGVKDAVAIVASTCKHEMPYHIFVGIRGKNWNTPISMDLGESGRRYQLHDLGRELTVQEKSAIYDKM